MYAILATEAKTVEITQGVAQNLVQLHRYQIFCLIYNSFILSLLSDFQLYSVISQKLKRKHDNMPALYTVFGIVSTGRSWLFICWNTSPGKPMVQVSKEYICRFKGEMEDEMKVLQIISTILFIQATELVTQINAGKITFDEPEVAKHICDSSSA
ncbi:hypothetical protein BC937DRAFT_92810 [Endogone sp. FLAS-F59071]|nr:hypothetical protein BC937DRAFT_92810 [Endogone sp. FLAS-F59071]|eukprot:RUS21394.1 hypothetical protein BC937DRAFT_92810 [Endogone sp. FLAS-F59071]